MSFGSVSKLSDGILVLPCLLAFPAFVVFGGTDSLLNWGPGMLAAGLLVCLLATASSAGRAWGKDLHLVAWLPALAVLAVLAGRSPALAAGAHDLALIAIAAAGYLVGKSASSRHFKALVSGLALATAGNFICALIQRDQPDWNPVYPARPGGFPAGFFAHYNHLASFSLGAAGILFTRLFKDRGLRWLIHALGFVAAIGSIVVSLSRGGNLALACTVAACLMLVLVRSLRQARFPAGKLVVMLSALLLLGPIAYGVVVKIGSFRGKVDAVQSFDDGGRLEFANAAVKLVAEQPWRGGGPGHFSREVYRVIDSSSVLETEPVMSHNELLQLAVDYGVVAAAVVVILVLAPLLACLLRYASGVRSVKGVWEAAGLGGMLLQANFDFVFHIAPCAFVGAVVLGRIGRKRWHAEPAAGSVGLETVSRKKREVYYQAAREAEASGRGGDDFLLAVRNYCLAHLAGRPRATLRLVVLLTASAEEKWQVHAANLRMRERMNDAGSVDRLVREIAADCAGGRVDRRVLLDRHLESIARRQAPSGWQVVRGLTMACLGALLIAGGIRLSGLLREAWKPLYFSERLPAIQQFQGLLRVQEQLPFLGIERKVLAVFLESLYLFDTLEGREAWADVNYRRILAMDYQSERDPGVALQVATVAGWAGDERKAGEMYDRAILVQGRHESVFMAHYHKGGYFHELALSTARPEDAARRDGYARRALGCFLRSRELAPHGQRLEADRQRLIGETRALLAGR
jgi:hypothetical protein